MNAWPRRLMLRGRVDYGTQTKQLMETEGEGGGVSAKKVHEESARGWLVPSTLALDI